MVRVHANVRTINGPAHNGHLGHRYRWLQNRASAVLDAYEEFDEGLNIDLVAHMHWISVQQIKSDIFSNPKDLKKRFGVKSSIKL